MQSLNASFFIYTSVTSDDMVTVMDTSHKVTEKDIEDSKKMILYNMYNTWSFRVG